MKIKIKHDEAHHRFISKIDGRIAKLDYKVVSAGKILDYYHTFVPIELRGHNLGQEIALFALNYAKENHLQIIPHCPFVKRIIQMYPEYEELVVSS